MIAYYSTGKFAEQRARAHRIILRRGRAKFQFNTHDRYRQTK